MGCVCGGHSSLGDLMQALHISRVSPLAVTRPSATHPEGFPLFPLPDDLAASLAREGNTLTVGMAMMAAREALSQAQLTPEALIPEKTGVCLGSSTGASIQFFEYRKALACRKDADPSVFLASLSYNPGPALARSLCGKPSSAKGPQALTVTNACTAGADAIGTGMAWLRQKLCDIVLAGGTDELCVTSITGFSRLLIMSNELCRPFDAGRKGLNLGEGAAVLVLERMGHALQRGATPIAILSGYGTAADAYHLTAPHPQGNGLKAALRAVMREAGISTDQVAFINAHGTGTQENDKTEAHVFRELFPHTPISATKGITGHTLGAAGAIEAAITIACLRDGKLPPSPGFTTPHPDLGIGPVTRVTPISGEYAISESLAFGGNNSALAFSKATQ